MPKVELYINNQLCDLKGDEEINVDYSIFDISKIDSRGGARSYEFEIPKTNRNKTVLENPEMVNNLSTVPYARNSALILVDGVDVLIRFCEVSGTKDGYKINLYGGNSDLFAALKAKKLTEIAGLSDFSHAWNIEVIVNSLSNTEGFIYPIIDYHADSPNFGINNDNRTMRADFMLPALFYNTLLSLIFSESGYELTNEIGDITKDLVIPVYKPPVSDFYGNKYNAIFNTLNDIVLNKTFPFAIRMFDMDTLNTYSGSYWVFLPYPVSYVHNTTTSSGYGLFFQDIITFKYRFRVKVTNPGTVPCGILLRIGNANGSVTNQALLSITSILPGTNDYIIEGDMPYPIAGSDGIPIIGTSYTVYWYFYQNTTAPICTIHGGSTFEIYDAKIVETHPVYYGQFFPFGEMVPDMTQMQLVKNYLQMFGLLVSVDEANKRANIIQFDTILSKIYLAYNWSDIIDFSEDYDVKFAMNDYAQRNLFNYSKDGDEIIPIGTNSFIAIDNKNLELEKELVTLDFAATNSNKRLVDNNINQIGIFVDGEYENEKNPRVLNLLRKVIGADFTITDTVQTFVIPTEVPTTYFIDEAQTLNLGFQNSLLPTYYELLSNVLNRVKIITISVRLSAADISQLDFTRPVFIKKFEAYFYISAIKGFSYTESKSTIVELVKLNING